VDKDVVIITACDQSYYPLCLDLLMSLQKACGALPRIRVLDVGMTPASAAQLANIVEKVIEPDWELGPDIGRDMGLPIWYRAMMARPFLPKYAGDAAVILWLDCDLWIQRLAPIQSLVDASRDGAIAIVEEHYGRGFQAQSRPHRGGTAVYSSSETQVKANMRRGYESCFGPQIAAAFGDLPCLNDGVFALRADSPSWGVWQTIYAPALARHYHPTVEQLALNVGIRQGLVPVVKQPQEANYTCHLELPWYLASSDVFTYPRDTSRVLGAIHLCDAKHFPLLPIPHFPDGEERAMPLDYRAFTAFIQAKNAVHQI
jgi:hypothetical protein